MTDELSTPDEKDQAFAHFYDELDDAADKPAVVARFVAAYPQWSVEFQRQARLQGAIATPEPPAVEVYPDRLPDFSKLREVGRGGMGVVFEAWQESLQRRVALKIRRGGASTPDLGRFRREQLILAQLHHTHIVPVHTTGQVGPWHYYAMAYIEGAALHHAVRRTAAHATDRARGQTPTLAELAREGLADPTNGPPAAVSSPPKRRLTLSPAYWRSVAEVLANAAEALDFAHRAGVLHRDVKPHNIMVDATGRCWLIDFGLARWQASAAAVQPPGGDSAPPGGNGLLTEGQAGQPGTPAYMAPEQWRNEPLSRRTDVWGLGVTLYELLALRPAFAATTREETRNLVLGAEPPPVRRQVADAPRDLVAVCRKAMRKPAAERYPTAQAFADDLRRWLRGEPTLAHGWRWLRRPWCWARRNAGWAATLAAAAVAVVGSLVLWGLLAQAHAHGEALRADAADDRVRASQRELKVQELQRLGLSNREAGWSANAWGIVRELTQLGSDARLRDQAAATLAGLDARRIKRFAFPASSVAFDRDGKRLLMGGQRDRPARLWDGTVDEPVFSQRLGDGPVAFTADGQPLQIVAQDNGALEVWDVARQQSLRTLKLPGDGAVQVRRLVLTPDGSHVAVVANRPTNEPVLAVWEVATGKLLQTWNRSATVVALTPDGKLLAAGDENGGVTLWSVADGKELAALRGVQRNAVSALAFGKSAWRRQRATGPLGGWLVGVGDTGAGVTVWAAGAKVPMTYCQGAHHQISALAFSPDGVTLASGGRREVITWDLATGQLLLKTQGNHVSGLAYSPDGRQLAVSSVPGFTSGEVFVVALDDGRGLKTLRGLVGQVAKVCYSPDGKRVAAISHKFDTAVWDLPSGRLLHVFDTPKGEYADNAAVAFSHDGKYLAYSAYDRAALYDLASGREVRSWALPLGFVDVLAFDPTGARLMSFRVETATPGVPPWGTKPSEYPRIGQMRNLLAAEPLKPVEEVHDFDWHVFNAVAPADGRFVVVDGVASPAKGGLRTVQAFNGGTGERLWSVPSRRALKDQHLTLDPGGTTLGGWLDGAGNGEEGTYMLLDPATGKLKGHLPAGVSGIGDQAAHFAGRNSTPAGLPVFRKSDDTALLILGLDVPPSSVQSQFHPTRPHLVWGNADGTVTVADLDEIQRRLAEFQLGW